MDSIAISFVVAVAVIVAAYFYFARTASTPSSSVSIQSVIADGKRAFNSSVALPPSLNQKQGAVFSYTSWIRIDDFAYKYGQPKLVFTKGPADLSSMCPGVFVDGNSNTLLVKLDTFGGQEVIPISNIPAKKWLHFALTVDQDSVDVYINGILHTHHTLTQLPKQNHGVVHTGLNGGFEGKIANLQYYSYLLTPSQVTASMGTAPQPDPNDGNAPLPPYFDISWWTNG
jgi:hypothetical protein